jgi:hypothetical protein
VAEVGLLDSRRTSKGHTSIRNITNAEEMPLPKLPLCSLLKFFYYFLMNVVGLCMRKYCVLENIRSGNFDGFTCFYPPPYVKKWYWECRLCTCMYVSMYIWVYGWMEVHLASTWTVERILFSAGIQEFIHPRSLPVNLNIPAWKMFSNGPKTKSQFYRRRL